MSPKSPVLSFLIRVLQQGVCPEEDLRSHRKSQFRLRDEDELNSERCAGDMKLFNNILAKNKLYGHI